MLYRGGKGVGGVKGSGTLSWNAGHYWKGYPDPLTSPPPPAPAPPPPASNPRPTRRLQPILEQNFHSPRPRNRLAAPLSPDTRARPLPASLPRISSSAYTAPQTPPPATASSTSRNATRPTRAPGKTPPHSARSAPARKSTSSTSVVLACFVPAASSRLPPFPQATMLQPPSRRQDALHISLTKCSSPTA